MEVAVDAGGRASTSDPASEFGRLAVEEWRVVEHDYDRLRCAGQLARGGQRQIEPYQLTIVDDLIVGGFEPGCLGGDPAARATDDYLADVERIALHHIDRRRQLAADAAGAFPPVIVVAARENLA